MSVELNHTIVHVRDARASAEFMAQILGLAAPRTFYHFTVVDLANGVSLDFLSTDEDVGVQHYAFLVSEEEFDAIFARIKMRGLMYWADPARTQPNTINTYYGGRGLYFEEPSGHLLEIITTPYGDEE